MQNSTTRSGNPSAIISAVGRTAISATVTAIRLARSGRSLPANYAHRAQTKRGHRHVIPPLIDRKHCPMAAKQATHVERAYAVARMLPSIIGGPRYRLRGMRRADHNPSAKPEGEAAIIAAMAPIAETLSGVAGKRC